MKKNTVKVLLLLTLSLTGTVSFAQKHLKRNEVGNKTNVEGLKVLAEKYHKQYIERHEEAVRLAKINNWPLIIREGSTYSELQSVDENEKPVYLTTFNHGSALTSRVDAIQPGGSLGLNLDGEGMSVGVWDGQYPLSSHDDFQGRFNPLDGSTANVQLHPTHVLGTIIGSGATDINARGMAYKAEGWVANFNDDFAEMADNADQLIISNHSYGIGNPSPSIMGAYIEQSKQVDEVTFDAPYYQPVFAAGNDGNFTYDRLTDRAVSKNSIAVAAVYEVDHTDPLATAQISNFSSWGPTNDNRIKPDISAKGVQVYSTTNQSDTSHGYLDGTSMAAPGVTGALLLVQQHYSNLHPNEEDPEARNFMMSSTLRALVAHTADDAGTTGPDPIYGWGLLNAKKIVETITNAGTTSIILELQLLPGETYSLDVTALGGQDVTATLAWTDPAHSEVSGSGSVLVNNLDLRVKKGNTTYLPWKLNTSQTAVKGDNNVDNIEKVEVGAGSGTYNVKVTHDGSTLVNPNGVPSQWYSLIITGVNGSLDTHSFKESLFTVWPNPANDVLNISLAAGVAANAHAEIFDMQGRTVLQTKLTGTDSVIATGSLTAGVYFVSVFNGDNNEVQKVVIK